MLNAAFGWLTSFLNWHFEERLSDLRGLEAKIRELEKAPQGIETLLKALELIQSKFRLTVWLEGDSAQQIEARDSQERSLTMGYEDGLYWCWRPWGKEADTTRYESLELLVWQVAGHEIPRIAAKAERIAILRRKARRDPATGAILIPANIPWAVFSREFTKHNGVWRRTRWYHRIFPPSC
jgi:hypothetical protein